MKNLLRSVTKQNIQWITRMTILLVTLGFFASPAYSQISSTTPSSRCLQGTVTLHATASSGTVKWYSEPFYGTAIVEGVSPDGTTFTTPVLEVTTAYYVDAVDAGGCSLNPGQARVPVIATISAGSVQASIFYVSNTFCKSVSTPQEVTRTGTAGGTYSYTVTSGGPTLALDPTTGAITPSASSIGTFVVTYTVTAAAGCTENPASTIVTITTAPVTPVISYTGSPYCTSSDVINVTQTGASGGTYSVAPAGLTINPTTGQLTPNGSFSGTYTITYFVSGAGGCAPQSATTSVTVLQLPAAAISYSTPFCISQGAGQAVNLVGTGVFTGGVYSAGAGLNINASTGAIDPSQSTAGTYTVTYTLSAVSPCAQVTAHTSVTINPLPTAVLSGTASICSGGSTNLSVALTGTGPWSFTYTDGFTPEIISNTSTHP